MPLSDFPTPTGSFMTFTGDTPPPDYLLCDGNDISREEYPHLFLSIGETYGPGDGQETFTLPLLSNRVIRTNP